LSFFCFGGFDYSEGGLIFAVAFFASQASITNIIFIFNDCLFYPKPRERKTRTPAGADSISEVVLWSIRIDSLSDVVPTTTKVAEQCNSLDFDAEEVARQISLVQHAKFREALSLSSLFPVPMIHFSSLIGCFF